MIVRAPNSALGTSVDVRSPDGTAAVQWQLWSTTARLVVTDPRSIDEAKELVDGELDRIGAACNRFDPTAEIHAVEAAAGTPVTVSALLAELLAVALAAAAFTDGDVDPTLGSALSDLGFDRNLADILWDGPSLQVVRHEPAWDRIQLYGRVVTLPEHVQLDLGATAKAHAADRCARRVAERLGVGVLVSLGGDIATAGPSPESGWVVLVQDQPGDPACTVAIPSGGALATSSTQSRTWQRGGHELHHILDPHTSRPADVVWRTASAVATTCVQANTLTTASLLRGHAALSWLRDIGAPARLVGARTPPNVVTVNGWPVTFDHLRSAHS